MASLSLCMIVRNEEKYLPDCLNSVEAVVDEVVVVDTGSTDHTLGVAERLGARCYSAPWTHDFAQARNISLAHATKDYILVLDADEVLTPGGRESLRRCLASSINAEGFLVHILNQTDGGGMIEIEESLNVRLFRNNPQYRFSGALHEQIAESILHADPPGRIFDSGIEILHHGYMKDMVMTRSKKERNLEIALREVQAHPGDGFRTFNLGMEYVRLEQYEEAVKVFQDAKTWSTPDALWVSRFYKVYASTLMRLGQWDRADALLEEALDLFPDYTDLLYLKGVCLYQKQECLHALRCFAKTIEMGDPPIPPYTIEQGISTYRPYFAMGQTYQVLGKPVEAAVSYRQAFELNPTFQQAYVRFANLLLKEDAGPATLRYLTDISALAGKRQNALLGVSLALADQFSQARPYLENAEQSEDVVEHLALTYACLNEGDNLRGLLDTHDQDGVIRAQIHRHLRSRGLSILEQGLLAFPQSQTLLSLKADYEKGYS